jgi:hypothetical protein
MNIQFTIQIFKEGPLYVAYAPQLDLSSCGGTKARARKNLLEATRLFLEEAERMGTLDQILNALKELRAPAARQSPASRPS